MEEWKSHGSEVFFTYASSIDSLPVWYQFTITLDFSAVICALWALLLNECFQGDRAAVCTEASVVFGKGDVTPVAVACKLHQRCEGLNYKAINA